MIDPILGPVFVQLGLTLSLVMMLGPVRMVEIKRRGFADIRANGFSTRAEQLSANYKHQFEAPVLFYVIALIFAFALTTTPLVLYLAWAYVVLRIIHSIIQLTHDIIFPWRFGVFAASVVVLVTLYIVAVSQVMAA